MESGASSSLALASACLVSFSSLAWRTPNSMAAWPPRHSQSPIAHRLPLDHGHAPTQSPTPCHTIHMHTRNSMCTRMYTHGVCAIASTHARTMAPCVERSVASCSRSLHTHTYLHIHVRTHIRMHTAPANSELDGSRCSTAFAAIHLARNAQALARPHAYAHTHMQACT